MLEIALEMDKEEADKVSFNITHVLFHRQFHNHYKYEYFNINMKT